LWRAGETAWTPEARAVFEELRLDGNGTRRQLLESDTFRALLARADVELPQAA
jgi:hypothetical protein